MARVAISDDFMSAFANVPRQAQKKVTEFLKKFRADPKSSGINYESINDAADPNFRSVRIDLTYRGIVRQPDNGDIYLLLWVDKHDDAYDWARKHRCKVHPNSGTLQVLVRQPTEASSIDELSPQSYEAAGQATKEVPARPLRLDYDAEVFGRLGVPEEWVKPLRDVRDFSEFERLEAALPTEAFEALCFLAEGIPLNEVLEEYAPKDDGPIDVEDIDSALARTQTQRHFHVVDGELELLEMLNAPLEKWRVFLHPTQHRLVNRHWNGPVRVLGGAGTGKTVVAMHRARWLAEHVVDRTSGDKVLFTTFTANLAEDIEDNLARLCSPDQLARIEVRNIDAWLHDFVRQFGLDYRVVYEGRGGEVDALWDKAMARAPAQPSLEESFYREEFRRVVQPNRVQDRAAYFRVSRVGRGVALTRKDRAAIWPVFEELRVAMRRAGVRFVEEAAQDALDMLQEGKVSRRYRAVVVDEAQDMGPEFMALIGALAGSEDLPKDSLFIVGDAHQRIYGRNFALSKCGINIRGRGRRLKINYRTTEETRKFATAILEGVPVDDMDEGADSLRGYRSLVHGQPPESRMFSSPAEEGQWVAEHVASLISAGEPAQGICVVAPTHSYGKNIASALDSAGLPCLELKRSKPDKKTDAVRVATIHRIKGLEFRYVFLTGMGDSAFEWMIDKTQDPVERQTAEQQIRCLVHVAATRASNRLFLSCVGSWSRFLKMSG